MKLAKLLTVISSYEKIRVFLNTNNRLCNIIYEGYSSQIRQDKSYRMVKNLDIDTVCAGRIWYKGKLTDPVIDIYYK